MADIVIVNIRPEHAPQLRQLQLICFPTVPPDELFHEEELVAMCDRFPEGNFVALDGATVVGLGAGMYTDFDMDHWQHKMDDIIDSGHDPAGAYYYGTDISVHPGWRGRGIGRLLYEARKGVVRQANKRGIVAGGFVPGYAQHKNSMSIESYVERVCASELFDPTLSFQLRNGFVVHGILRDYMTIGNSDGFATLIVWDNPDYQP